MKNTLNVIEIISKITDYITDDYEDIKSVAVEDIWDLISENITDLNSNYSNSFFYLFVNSLDYNGLESDFSDYDDFLNYAEHLCDAGNDDVVEDYYHAADNASRMLALDIYNETEIYDFISSTYFPPNEILKLSIPYDYTDREVFKAFLDGFNINQSDFEKDMLKYFEKLLF